MGILSFLRSSPKYKPGVYCITNKYSGWFYIGATTKTMMERWDRHRYMLDTGRHHNKRLQADWNTYGSRAFRFAVIEVVDDTDDVFKREEYWQRLRYNHQCYNPNPDAPPPYMSRSKPQERTMPTRDAFLQFLRSMQQHGAKRDEMWVMFNKLGWPIDDELWDTAFRTGGNIPLPARPSRKRSR